MARMRATVPAPQAAAPRVGLLVAADTTRDGDADGRWIEGLTYAAEAVGGYRGINTCADGTIDGGPQDPLPHVDYQPWTLQMYDDCNVLGARGIDMPARVRRWFAAGESFAIARELWTGDLTRQAVADEGSDIDAPNLYLTDPTKVVPVADAPVKLAAAVGLLEDALGTATLGGPGFLHVPRIVATRMPGTRREGQQLFTLLDNQVVPDAGYTGTAPGDVAPADGVVWLYATGPVVVRRSPIVMNDPVTYVDERTNKQHVSGDRFVAATFDPGALFGVPVALELTP